ncbi:bromodomain-containing protein DDB_G0280777 [Drosophila mojavensis]|uniref:Uncharacterized protein n=1 Tax=Drosophila mojavensis TaxID=7230 RepID=B4KIE5_DROMO|nr:bromodomain-containing protein DDB_G0280777 [Drosophila mojavensis]EDW13442.1 uncharacterized protein Dmoj_GI19978 [Drosophila mojavensis]
MDDDNTKQRETHVQLPDANVNETETDELQQQQQQQQRPQQSQQQQLQLELELELEEGVRVKPRFVNFDWQQRQQLDEAKALVKDMIDYMLSASETEKDAEEASKIVQLEQTTAGAGAAVEAVASSVQSTDARLQRILRLLDCYTRNLEEHVLSVRRGETCTCTELQLTQNCELGTQTLPLNSLRVDVTSTIRPKINARGIQLQEQQQQQEQRQPQQQSQQQQQTHSDTTSTTPAPLPAAAATATAAVAPCERRYHTITISANTTSAYASRPRPNTLLGRIGHTLGDFAGAFCLCLQVNKDCVFCLGFFIAFVISASFLTAFFYRTINLTQSLRPSPIDSGDSAATPGNMVTLRFNGGYYYIYNSQRQNFL